MLALKYCPQLRFIETSHNISVGFLNYIAKHGQNLYGLDLDFQRSYPKIQGSLLKKGIKNLKHLGLIGLDKYQDVDLLTTMLN